MRCKVCSICKQELGLTRRLDTKMSVRFAELESLREVSMGELRMIASWSWGGSSMSSSSSLSLHESSAVRNFGKKSGGMEFPTKYCEFHRRERWTRAGQRVASSPTSIWPTSARLRETRVCPCCLMAGAGVSILRYFSRTLLIIYCWFYKKNWAHFIKKNQLWNNGNRSQPSVDNSASNNHIQSPKKTLASLHIIEFYSFSM